MISDRIGRVLKTRAGVHAEFLRLTRDKPRLDPDLRDSPSRSYNLEVIADRGTDPDIGVTRTRAADAIATGRRLVARIEAIVQ